MNSSKSCLSCQIPRMLLTVQAMSVMTRTALSAEADASIVPSLQDKHEEMLGVLAVVLITYKEENTAPGGGGGGMHGGLATCNCESCLNIFLRENDNAVRSLMISAEICENNELMGMQLLHTTFQDLMLQMFPIVGIKLRVTSRLGKSASGVLTQAAQGPGLRRATWCC